MFNFINIIFVFALISKCHGQYNEYADENYGISYLNYANRFLQEYGTRLAFAEWEFNTNITDYNEQRLIQASIEYNNVRKELWKYTITFNYSAFNDESIKRQFKMLSVLGVSALESSDFERFTKINTEMEKIYSEGTVCINQRCDVPLDPDLTDIMAKSRDYNELSDAWIQWRDNVGRTEKPLYKEYVNLGNKAAVLNGFETYDDLWMFDWEVNGDEFKSQIDSLWNGIEEFYKKLHAYVRSKLREKYGPIMPDDGTIPAHLLGNMWAQEWNNILDLVIPFPNKASIDVTEEMIRQNYTVLQMYQLSEKFYTDLGLIKMPKSFWKESMLTKPLDRNVVCHASAWDFYNQKDFRIKQCTEVTMEHLVTIHHEMGHIQYYLQYKDQPITFREGANPGFHEAIGDLMALSVSTPGHLNKIGLLNNYTDDIETTINYQMLMALEKLAFLPFAYIMDLWRWDVFSGKTNVCNWNRRWWELRIKYQGISPPIVRNEIDFDAGAKYHIVSDTEYVRYFVSHILQFSFHKSLCTIAQPNVPLYKCDIDGNIEAGQKLAQMLSLGASKPWPEQLELLTGNRDMSIDAILEYFEPLINYLNEQTIGEEIGWNITGNYNVNCGL